MSINSMLDQNKAGWVGYVTHTAGADTSPIFWGEGLGAKLAHFLVKNIKIIFSHVKKKITN